MVVEKEERGGDRMIYFLAQGGIPRLQTSISKEIRKRGL